MSAIRYYTDQLRATLHKSGVDMMFCFNRQKICYVSNGFNINNDSHIVIVLLDIRRAEPCLFVYTILVSIASPIVGK